MLATARGPPAASILLARRVLRYPDITLINSGQGSALDRRTTHELASHISYHVLLSHVRHVAMKQGPRIALS